jgi:hypothetical protein
VYADGSPFFYLGDTAWELFHRLNRDDVDYYLTTRAEQRFTVIQAVVLAEMNGLTVPNPYGDVPLIDLDPARPNEAYFTHVDYVVQRAGELGVIIGMLPTWGSWAVREEHPLLENHCIFTPENALTYGQFLGNRYKDAGNIIWILGGDRFVQDERHLAVLRGMAHGLAQGDGGSHLRSFHPRGGRSSAEDLHDEEWLDFNMLQSGHAGRDTANYAMIEQDYARTPVKPCMDGEPRYEDHPVMGPGWKSWEGYFDDYDARKAAYWAVFAGAHGHTYGCHPVWQMLGPGRDVVNNARRPWYEAVHLPGACQMQHVRALIESRPFVERIPDQAVLCSDNTVPAAHMQATRGSDGSYLMVYVPVAGQQVTVRLDVLSGEEVCGWWYDPRNGSVHAHHETYEPTGTRVFESPAEGPDWVLVLDDVDQSFPPPGAH